LAEGPSKEAVEDVHREAHGLLASSIIEVEPGPVQSFFGSIPTHPVGEPYVESAVRAELFTDNCGSTELTQRLGDAAGTELVREHDRVVRRALEARDGREVKHTGDGIMASFASVAGSVEAAIEMQSVLAARNTDAEIPIDLRIGISAGEPVTDAGDLFGATVQLASRLCASSPPGGITVSVAVRELCMGKMLRFDAGRSVALKGFTDPVQVYDVSWSS
jgi:class 3 adenylate cyclase